MVVQSAHMVMVLNANAATLFIMLQEYHSRPSVWHTIRIMHITYLIDYSF
jgi:hypothetical protein